MLSKFLSYLLCSVLALQGGIAVFVQQQHLSAVQATTQADVELICTGAEMKWISVSLTEQLGQFVYVDSPDNIDQRILDNACPGGDMSEMQSAIALISNAIHSSFISYLALKLELLQRPYTSFTFQTAQSRAPPIA